MDKTKPQSYHETKLQIIFISDTIVSKARFQEAGLEYLNNNGWDVTLWVYGQTFNVVECFDGACDSCRLRRFDTYRQLDKAVKLCRDVSIFYFPSRIVESTLFIPIARYNCRYIILGNRAYTPKPKESYPKYDAEPIPFRQQFIEFVGRLKKERFKYFERKAKEILNWVYCHRNHVIPAKEHLPLAVFTTNEFSEKWMMRSQKWVDECNTVYTPSMQYEYYLEEERKGEDISEDFVLLVASGMGFEYLGQRRETFKDEIYRKDINEQYLRRTEHMLDLMEEHYGLPVIVAGHPRAVYKGYDFGGRKVIFGRTPELVKKCKVYIGTISYAVTFALLYNKRMLFYYNDALMKTKVWIYAYIPLMEALQIKGMNLDNPDELENPWDYEELVSEAVKEDFIRTYHNSLPNGNKLYGEILEDFLLTV